MENPDTCVIKSLNLGTAVNVTSDCAKAKYDRQSHLLNIKWSCPILLMEVYQWKLKSVASIVPSDCDETLTVSYNLQILNMGKAEL